MAKKRKKRNNQGQRVHTIAAPKAQKPAKTKAGAYVQQVKAAANKQVDAIHQSAKQQVSVAQGKVKESVQQIKEEQAAKRKAMGQASAAKRHLQRAEEVYLTLRAKTADINSIEHRVLVDVGGGIGGSVVYQGLAVLIRHGLTPKPGETQISWYQRLPRWAWELIFGGAALGGWAYELFTRPEVEQDEQGNELGPYIVTEGREVFSEASKVTAFAHLNQAVSIGVEKLFFQ